MLERQVEKFLREEIKSLGGEFYKWVSPGQTGVPDRICILPGGKVYFVEVKEARGATRKHQKLILKRLRELGTQVRVIHGREEAFAFLTEIREELSRDEL